MRPQRLLIIFSIVLVLKGFSQDAYFTSTNLSLIYLNPSYAGSNGFIRIQSTARVQDYNSNRSFLSSFTSMDAYLKPLNGGLAVSYFYDDYSKGQLKTSAFGLAY